MSVYRHALIASLLLGGSPGSAGPPVQVGATIAPATSAQALANVQGRINDARLRAVTTDDAAGLEAIAAQLNAARTDATGQPGYYIAYWLSYIDYLIASRRLKEKRRAEAATLLAEANTLLNAIPSPDVETYTLLSLVAGLRIVAGTPENMAESMSQARDALERAITLDPNNARVLYARALADYTTPKEYGGGRVAERFAWRAVGRPIESTRGLKPGWGHDDSAALLVRILRASDRNADADKLIARVSAQYPASAPLHQVSEPTK